MYQSAVLVFHVVPNTAVLMSSPMRLKNVMSQ